MDFRTIVHIPPSEFPITHAAPLMLFGSCFSENIGKKLLQNKFSADVNPYGILYNPASVSAAVRRLLRNEVFTQNDLVFHDGLYQSFMHHGSFSHADGTACLAKISSRFHKAARFIRQTEVLLVTFGTAYVYRLKSNGSVVGNCHKFPSDAFERQRLSPDEIVDDWTALIHELLSVNPRLKIVFTVSPIRHLKDGAHENQLSKSTLHLAIDSLMRKLGQAAHYFPAYEIVQDELRDYRFYAADMTHPSDTAVEYVWQRFSETYFSDQTRQIMREWSVIRRALEHRPLNGHTDNYRAFLLQTREKLNRFAQQYPFLPCAEEITQLTSIIQSFNQI